jgi:hypothetical protein
VLYTTIGEVFPWKRVLNGGEISENGSWKILGVELLNAFLLIANIIIAAATITGVYIERRS